LVAWLAGAAGGLAAYRALRGKRAEAEPGADARAAELKAKLDEARVVADDRDAPETVVSGSGEVAVDETDVVDPQARRAQVHEQGRAALDEMRGEQTP
jgi:hypothetical protein